MKKIIALFLALIICFSFAACGGSSSRGDGKSSCKNCGRSGSIVAGYGYCYSCYEGFTDWQDRNGY